MRNLATGNLRQTHPLIEQEKKTAVKTIMSTFLHINASTIEINTIIIITIVEYNLFHVPLVQLLNYARINVKLAACAIPLHLHIINTCRRLNLCKFPAPTRAYKE